MRIRFLGTGDAFGTGGRFHTCFWARSDASTFLIDCGASSLTAMHRFDVDPLDIDTILISHLHGDHFGGLPFVLLQYHFGGRTAPLTVAGPPGLEARLWQTCEALFTGSSKLDWNFTLELVELKVAERAQVGALAVTPLEVQHPSGAPSYGLRVSVDGITVGYSGDTEWCDALPLLADGADLFITECYSYDIHVPLHLDYLTLQDKLSQLGCRRLLLTHLGPTMIDRLDQLELEVAYDGLEIVL